MNPSDNDFAGFDEELIFKKTYNLGTMSDNDKSQQEGCTNCNKTKKCIRDTEFCQGIGMYCIRHCPCKQNLGRIKRAYKRTKDKVNCDDCDPKRARCHICNRCTYCCEKLGRCTVKTPPAKRSNYDSTMANLHKAVDAQGKTPLVMKLQTGELELRNESKEARLFDVLGIDKSSYRNFPKESVRRQSNSTELMEQMKNSQRAREQTIQVFGQLVEEAAKVVMPRESQWLLEQHFQKTSKARGEDNKRGRITEAIAHDVIDLTKKMPPHSMGYRISRGLLTCNASKHDLCTILEDLGPPNFGPKARKRGREDLERAREEGLDPKKRIRTVGRVSEDNIIRIVKHVLSFVQTLSWGTKELKQNGKNAKISFPKLTRTHAIETMFKDYARKEAELRCIEFNENVQAPQRTIYFDIASALTANPEKKMSCIDYVMDILVNDPIKTIVQIIEDLVAPSRKPTMKEHMRVVQHFLKYQYDSHLSRNSKNCLHNVNHALGVKPLSQNGGSTATSSTSCACIEIEGFDQCRGCKFVEYFMNAELRDAVEESRTNANSASVDDALRFLRDSSDKFRRYQAHRVRVVNQQKAIKEVDSELKQIVLTTRKRGRIIKIIIDFKQKYLEQRLRSSQMNDFAQRGISWHIVVIEYYDWDEEKQEVVRIQIPLDQILNSGNKQDGQCVMAMLDAMLKMIQVELPFVEEAIIVSDNANCYQSREMIFSICLLNQLRLQTNQGGPLVVKYIHPETQDGKGSCDSHAAVAGRHVDTHFICARKDGTLTSNDACTPTEVAKALCINGGVKNCAVQLIKLNFTRLQEISKSCTGANAQALEYFARANEIRFFPQLDALEKWSKLDLLDKDNWVAAQPLIQVINYSKISEGTVFRVGFSDWKDGSGGSFTPVVSPDDYPGNWFNDWHSRAIANRLFERAKDDDAISHAAQSLFDHARKHMESEKVGMDLFAGAMAEMTNKSGSDETAGDDELQEEMDDDDVLEEDECFHFFQRKHACETRLGISDDDFLSQLGFDDDFLETEDEDDIEADKGANNEDPSLPVQHVQAPTKAHGLVKEKITALVKAPSESYDESLFLTGVEVSHHKPFHVAAATIPRKEKGKSKTSDIEEYDSKQVIDQAIGLAEKYIGSADCSIRPSVEEPVEVFKLAENWTPSENLIRERGWARRGPNLYGASYMNDDFRAMCIEQFNRGVANKGDKQSPSQTLELMKERHPGLYCYPGLHEINRFYSGMNQQTQKTGMEVTQTKKQGEAIPEEIKEELQSLLEENSKLTGGRLFELWKEKCGSSHVGYDQKKVRKHANYLRARLLYDYRRLLKRRMAG